MKKLLSIVLVMLFSGVIAISYGQNKSNPNQSNSKYKFQSSYYDIEYNGQILNTVHENTIHTFDLGNKKITQKSKVNGKWVIFSYIIKSSYQDKLTTVFVINSLGIKEIWITPSLNCLGYDYDDGKRIACYDISSVD